MQLLLLVGLSLSLGAQCSATGYLFVSNSTHILKVNVDAEEQEIFYSSTHADGRIVGLAIDHTRGLLFWSDIGSSTRGIYRADYRTSTWPVQEPTHIVDAGSGSLEINALSVHSAASLVYWTDSRRRTIEVAAYDGTNRRVLSVSGLSAPRGIVVDHKNGYLFWNDQGSGTISRSRLDGSDQQVIHSDAQWPNHMIVHKLTDSSEDLLYWVEAKDKTLRSSKLDGSYPRTVLNLRTDDNPIFGLTVHDDFFYVTAWNIGVILRGHEDQPVIMINSVLGSDNIFGVVSMDNDNTGEQVNLCDQKSCSHLCLPITGSTARCSCPSFGGLVLDGNSVNCRAPNTNGNLLFYALADEGEVGFYDPTGARNQDRYTAAKSTRPVAVAYDRHQQVVYWSDVLEQTIRYSKLDGSDQGTLLDKKHSLGVVDGLEFDSLNNNLYYAHMGYRMLEGIQYKWHKIEMINVDSKRRVTVSHHAEKPRGLALSGGELYYTDWGTNAAIYKSKLDGSEMELLLSRMDNPNGVAAHGDILYITDSHYKQWGDKENVEDSDKGKVYQWDPDNGKLEALTGVNVQIPFGITHDNDNSLYVSDWGTRSIIRIIRPGESTQEVETVYENIGTPMDLHVSVPTAGQDPCSVECDDGVCIHDGQSTNCQCSSYDNKVIVSSDSGPESCQTMDSMMLVADYNGIKARSLSPGEEGDTNTLLETDSNLGNIVAVVVDEPRSRMYYSDVNRRNIYRAWLDGANPEILVYTNDVIDGMVLDATNERLYWTDFISGSIRSIDTNGDENSYKILARKLDRPRAITLKNGYIYWTEWGIKPRVGRVSTSGREFQILVDAGLDRPNTLVVEEDKMYIGEASGTLYQCNLDGTNLQKLGLMNLGADHIYYMEKHNKWIFYSDWKKGSVSVVDMDTGYHHTLMSGLIRPTQFHIKWPTPDDENPCESDPCSHRCHKLPDNTFYCTCPPSRDVTTDGQCMTGTSEWALAEGSCDTECGTNNPNKVCVQKKGTLTFECHCEGGYHANILFNLDGCSPCATNFYKALPDPDSCSPCPEGSSNMDTGNTGCICDDGKAWNSESSSCEDTKQGECPQTIGVDACDSNCESDIGCTGAQRCCESLSCNARQCKDPVVLDSCVYDGNVYHPGAEFHPTPCVQCTCHADNIEHGNPQYGGAVCTTVQCVTPLCEDAIVKDGECCASCQDKDKILEITNCPGDTVELLLPHNQSYAELSITWSTIDYSGRNRHATISEVPRFYHWSGEGTTQSVEVVATVKGEDGEVDTDTCVFDIKVVDYSPPNVTCPGNKDIGTMDDTATVYFDLPLWYEDNVCSRHHECTVEWTSPSGSELEVGTHSIGVTVQDGDKNKAECQFTVNVEKVESCPLPQIFNGYFTCNMANGVKTCELTCREGYEPYKVERIVSCTGGVWSPVVDADYRRYACARSHPKLLSSNVELYGLECEPQSSADVMADRIVSQIESSVNSDITSSSGFVDIDISTKVVTCLEGEGERKRRDGSDMMIRIVLTTEISSNMDETDMRDLLDQLRRDIQRLAENGILSEVLGNQEFYVSSREVNSQCGYGRVEVPQEDYCVECPMGTFHFEKRCEDCPSGYYNDRTGQTECLICKEPRTESQNGSISSDMCIIPGSGTGPDDGEGHDGEPKVNGALIGGIVGGIVGAALLITVLCCLFCKSDSTHQKKYIIQDSPSLEHENKAYDPEPRQGDAEAGQVN